MIVPPRTPLSLHRVDMILAARLGPIPVGNRKHRVQPSTMKMVLLALHAHEGQALSYRYLADLLEVCDSVAFLSIKALRSVGLVAPTPGTRRGRPLGGGGGTMYAIDWRLLESMRPRKKVIA